MRQTSGKKLLGMTVGPASAARVARRKPRRAFFLPGAKASNPTAGGGPPNIDVDTGVWYYVLGDRYGRH
jgi:hypothetical protein